jgi:hypothetical protein
MKLEALLKKYVAEESYEAGTKTGSEIKPQEQKYSHPIISGEKEREDKTGGEINRQPVLKRERKKAEADWVKGE